MKAIILNSGLGKRMGDFTANNHKSMAKLKNGETIFSRQIRILSDCGINEFIITTGYFSEQLEKEAEKFIEKGIKINFVHNPISDKTNYIYSLYLAKNYIQGDVLLMHGDLVFNKDYINKILSSSIKNLGSVNELLPLPQKDFKSAVKNGVLKKIAIDIFDDCCAFQPLYKLSSDVMNKWMKKIIEYCELGNTSVYAENALNEILNETEIRTFSYVDDYVDEVDTIEDLNRVSNDILNFDYQDQEIIVDNELSTMIKKN